MPLRSSDPDEAMYAFVFLCSGIFSQILMFVGDWRPVDFAAHVYHMIVTRKKHGLEGATDRCWKWSGPTHVLLQALGGLSHTCAMCQAMAPTTTTMKCCRGCFFARYCSRTCQNNHWYNRGHKEDCQRMRVEFPGDPHSRFEYTRYGYISGYEFDLWRHLIGDMVDRIQHLPAFEGVPCPDKIKHMMLLWSTTNS